MDATCVQVPRGQRIPLSWSPWRLWGPSVAVLRTEPRPLARTGGSLNCRPSLQVLRSVSMTALFVNPTEAKRQSVYLFGSSLICNTAPVCYFAMLRSNLWLPVTQYSALSPSNSSSPWWGSGMPCATQPCATQFALTLGMYPKVSWCFFPLFRKHLIRPYIFITVYYSCTKKIIRLMFRSMTWILHIANSLW